MEKLNMNEVTFYNINGELKFNFSQLVMTNSKGLINGIQKKITDSMNDVFNEANKLDKSEYNFHDLDNSFNRVREKEIAKVRTLRKQEAGGFALVGTLTIIGTIILSIIIFTIIGNIVM